VFDPEGVAELDLAPLQGARPSLKRSGGLRFAPTPGYFLATLQVADAVDARELAVRQD